MITEIRISTILECLNSEHSSVIAEHFFRQQALDTLQELGERVRWDDLDNATIELDLEYVEELFYSETIERIAAELGLNLDEDNEDY